MNYKGFGIIKDKMLGFSGIDRQGQWMVSCISEEEIKTIINKIIQL